MNFKKVLTENPFVDEIVHATKIMTYGTVLKDQDAADANETAKMARNADIYIACRTNQERFELMVFNKLDLINLGLSERPSEKYPQGQVNACLEDKYNIPPEVRDQAVAICKARVLRDYREVNNYYRMLNGLPDIGEDGLLIDNSVVTDPNVVIDTSKYIHEMSDSEINVLDELGIIDNLIAQYPEKKYLRHLGGKRIDIVTARKAGKFDTLYVPSIDFEELRQIFIDRVEQNKHYVLRCVYSEAMKLGSEEFYDKFMMLFIVLEAAIDLLSETQVFIAKKDVFNVRSIQYIFSAYGIPYYDEIPIKYQVNMMKNLNKLIKYKATGINMVDICSLFGFPNIQVFKYYILKNRKFDPETDDYIFNYNDDGTENLEADYELKFLRVPLEDMPDEYIRDANNYSDYSTITAGDRYWDENGTLSTEVRKFILQKEFNIMRSKYFSIDTTCELTQISFELPYFFNMLYDDVKLEEQLKLSVPYISNNSSFKFTDIFIMIFALGYMYNGLEDSIMDTTGKVLHIMGFNFKADLAALGEYVAEKGYTLEELGVSDFVIPDSSVLNYNQLLEIFTNNQKIYKHVTNAMMEADDKNIYDIYKKIYDSLMIMDFTNHYFRIPGTTTIAPTYTEFMKYRDQTLYQVLVDIDSIGMTENEYGQKVLSSDLTERRREIDKYIEAIVIAMQEYIDSDKFKFVYSNIPGETADYIQKYVMKVINFFKSYKMDLIGMNTIYTIDDKFDNLVRAIDKIDHIDITYFKHEIMQPDEQILGKVSTQYNDRVQPLDELYISYIRTILKMLDDFVYERTRIDDKVRIIGEKSITDTYAISDDIKITSSLVS